MAAAPVAIVMLGVSGTGKTTIAAGHDVDPAAHDVALNTLLWRR